MCSVRLQMVGGWSDSAQHSRQSTLSPAHLPLLPGIGSSHTSTPSVAIPVAFDSMAPVLQATMSVCGLAPGHAFRPQSALPRHPSHRGVCSPMRTHDQHHSVAFQRPIVTMRAGRGPAQSQDDNNDDDGESGPYVRDTEYEERVIQVRRVTKVVKGGKQLSFRAVVSGAGGRAGVPCSAGVHAGGSTHHPRSLRWWWATTTAQWAWHPPRPRRWHRQRRRLC